MNLESIILSEISQTEKEKCHMISLICGIKNKQNKLIDRRDWLLLNVMGVGYGVGWGGE